MNLHRFYWLTLGARSRGTIMLDADWQALKTADLVTATR
jgi:hypothetical protein